MQEFFNVFPSEALLLGLALGEYLRLTELGLESSFERALYRRVYPFVGDFIQQRWVPIDRSKLPEDIDWSKARCFYEPECNGRRFDLTMEPLIFKLFADEESETESETESEEVAQWREIKACTTALAIEQREDGIYELILDEHRHSPLDLLMQYLTADDEEPRRKFNENPALLIRWGIADGTEVQPRRKPKSPKQITQLLEDLVRHNECLDAFQIGQILGRFFAECMKAEQQLADMEKFFVGEYGGCVNSDTNEPLEPDHEQFHRIGNRMYDIYCDMEDVWAAIAKSIRENELLGALAGDIDFTQAGKATFAGRYFGIGLDVDGIKTGEDALDAILSVRTSLCLILGNIRGRLYAKDKDDRINDTNRVTPREFFVAPTSSPEDVEGPLRAAQHTLDSNLGKGITPEDVIRGLGASIEVLARKLWPATFKFSHGPEVRPGLDIQRLLIIASNSSNALERRFADVARPLYSHYRNQANHEPNTFACSNHEMRHFLTGVQALLDLKKKIEEDRKSSR